MSFSVLSQYFIRHPVLDPDCLGLVVVLFRPSLFPRSFFYWITQVLNIGVVMTLTHVFGLQLRLVGQKLC